MARMPSASSTFRMVSRPLTHRCLGKNPRLPTITPSVVGVMLSLFLNVWNCLSLYGIGSAACPSASSDRGNRVLHRHRRKVPEKTVSGPKLRFGPDTVFSEYSSLPSAEDAIVLVYMRCR